MDNIEKKIEQVNKSFHDFKELHAKELAEAKKLGEATQETKQAVDRANCEIQKLQDEIKALHAAASRHEKDGSFKETPEDLERKEAFNKYLRKGIESKALSVDSDPDGGFLVLPEMAAEMTKKEFETTPMRQLASVTAISSDALEILHDLDEADAEWVSEQGARNQTGTPQIFKQVIPVHELFAKPRATQKFLDDAFVNVEAWLTEKVREKFARKEASAFILGDGVGKARGILSYTNGTGFGQIEQINTGNANLLTADGLLNLVYSLKQSYRSGAAFLMKRSTILAARKLKDLDGQYLWAPGLQAGQPDSLLGYAVFEGDDMPEVAAGNLVAAFGNFRQGYQIVDRFGVRVLRDPYSAKPFVEFYTTKRVGGDVKNYEALKLLKVSA